jgi:hypothetical protein
MSDREINTTYTAAFLRNQGKQNRVQVRRDGDPVLTIPVDMALAIKTALALNGVTVGEVTSDE